MSPQVAIVACAGGALGHATTMALAKDGLTVVAVDRNVQEMRDLADSVHTEGVDP